MYDGMAFPESEPSSLRSKIKHGFEIVSSFFGAHTESELKQSIPNHEQAQQQALHCFLQQYKAVLENMEFSTKNRCSLTEFVDNLFSIFVQLRLQRTCNDIVPDYDNPRIAHDLAKVMFVLLLCMHAYLFECHVLFLYNSMTSNL